MTWSEQVCRCLALFTQMRLLGEMCVGFHSIQIEWRKYTQLIEYKMYTECVILASLVMKRQRNKDKMKRVKASLWLLAGKTGKYLLRDGFSNWGDGKFTPTEGNLKKVFSSSLNRPSLNPNCLVKICPAYRVQVVHLRCHIGLFIHQKTKKKDKTSAMRKGIPSFCLLAGKTLNSFLKK